MGVDSTCFGEDSGIFIEDSTFAKVCYRAIKRPPDVLEAILFIVPQFIILIVCYSPRKNPETLRLETQKV